MVKSSEGEIVIQGRPLEIYADYACLTKALLDVEMIDENDIKEILDSIREYNKDAKAKRR